MKLVEFTAYWAGDYSKEDIETYNAVYGDDRYNWPDTNSYGPITIDIQNIIRLNPGSDENKTTVELAYGKSFTLALKYNELVSILKFFGIEIHSFKDGIPYKHKPV